MTRAPKPEFEFLCCLVRPQHDRGRALELAQQGLDWASVARLAAAHGVRPHLRKALNDGVRVDEFSSLDQTLEIFQRGHIARNLHMASELLRVANMFGQRRIAFATFKGVALAISLYGDISGREFNDIDIIVRATDLEVAESALESCGYRPARGNSREWREVFLGYQGQYTFVRANSVPAIDLHWDFASHGFPFPLLARDIWSTLGHVPIAGRAIPTFGSETMAIYLVGHGAKESWKSLGWVCDFAEFYQQRRSDIDWIDLSLRLDRNGRRQLLLGLLLAKELLGVPVHDEFLKHVDCDSRTQALLELAMQRISNFLDAKNPHPDMQLTDFEACETWIDRLRLLWCLVSTRTTGDYEAMPLPRSLWRLYHLIRPFRLAVKILAVSLPYRFSQSESTSNRPPSSRKT
jgi:hypothetical protein